MLFEYKEEDKQALAKNLKTQSCYGKYQYAEKTTITEL